MIRQLSLIAAVSMLSACAGLPAYTFQPGQPTTTIDLSNVPSPSFCVEGKGYSLKPDARHQGTLPVGKRVAIWSFVYLSGYQQYWTCSPSISFVPTFGTTYYGNLEMLNQKCRLEVYRGGASNRIGLDLEPSVDRGYCPIDSAPPAPPRPVDVPPPPAPPRT